MRRLALTLVVAFGLVVGQASPSSAAVGYVVIASGSTTTKSYTTPVALTTVGGPLVLRNQDVLAHSLVSDAVGSDDQPWCTFYAPGACPLFRAPTVDAGGRERSVQGLESTQSGQTYGFHCGIHPSVKGTLVTL